MKFVIVKAIKFNSLINKNKQLTTNFDREDGTCKYTKEPIQIFESIQNQLKTKVSFNKAQWSNSMQ